MQLVHIALSIAARHFRIGNLLTSDAAAQLINPMLEEDDLRNVEISFHVKVQYRNDAAKNFAAGDDGLM